MIIRRSKRILKEMDSSVFCDTSAGSVGVPDMLGNGDNFNSGDNRVAGIIAPIQRRKKKASSEDEENVSSDDFIFVKNVKPADAEKSFNTLTEKERENTFHPLKTEDFKSDINIGFRDGKDIVAVLLGKELKKEKALYTIIYVNPRYRKNGLAEKLMEKYIDIAEEKGFKKIIYRVSKTNKGSLAIITKFRGKEIDDERDDHRKFIIEL